MMFTYNLGDIIGLLFMGLMLLFALVLGSLVMIEEVINLLNKYRKKQMNQKR